MVHALLQVDCTEMYVGSAKSVNGKNEGQKNTHRSYLFCVKLQLQNSLHELHLRKTVKCLNIVFLHLIDLHLYKSSLAHAKLSYACNLV